MCNAVRTTDHHKRFRLPLLRLAALLPSEALSSAPSARRIRVAECMAADACDECEGYAQGPCHWISSRSSDARLPLVCLQCAVAVLLHTPLTNLYMQLLRRWSPRSRAGPLGAAASPPTHRYPNLSTGEQPHTMTIFKPVQRPFSGISDAIRGQPSSHKIKRGASPRTSACSVGRSGCSRELVIDTTLAPAEYVFS